MGRRGGEEQEGPEARENGEYRIERNALLKYY